MLNFWSESIYALFLPRPVLSLWLTLALSGSLRLSQALSLALSGSLWLSQALFGSPNLLTKPLLGSQGPFSARSSATALQHFLQPCKKYKVEEKDDNFVVFISTCRRPQPSPTGKDANVLTCLCLPSSPIVIVTKCPRSHLSQVQMLCLLKFCGY